jgi:hypothetical protein
MMAHRLIRLLAALFLVTGAVQFAVRREPAQADGAAPAFSATAAADGVRFSMTVPNAPGTSTPIDGGGPSAQAAVSSLGASQAFASLPYPGDLPVRLPGLLAGVGVAGVPQYPFYAASDHPTAPDARLEAPGYLLSAMSREDRSAAKAAGQGPDGTPVSYRSTASVGPVGDGTVVAAADSLARNLRIGDLVIGEAASHARVRLAGAGQIERSAAFELTGVSIAGTAVHIGEGGVTISGTSTPLPGDHGLLAALAQGGIGVAYLAPLETAHGIVAGGLRITVTGTAPDGTQGTGALTLGRAAASVETGAGSVVTSPPPVGVEIEPPPAASDPSGPAVPDMGEGAGAGPVDAGDSGLFAVAPTRRVTPAPSGGAAPLGAIAPGTGGMPDETAAPADAGRTEPVGTAVGDAVRNVAEPFDAGGFYPMLVVAAAVFYAVAQALRILGVR